MPPKLEIQEVPVKDITTADYNPRVPVAAGSRFHEDLTRSLTKFGLVEPLVWNKRSGRLVGGHQRLAVLIETGAKTAPCSVVDLDDAAERSLNLALNRIGGEWNPDQLASLLQDLHGQDDLLLAAGFSEEERETLTYIATLENHLDTLAEAGEPYRPLTGLPNNRLNERDAGSPLDYPEAAETAPDSADPQPQAAAGLPQNIQDAARLIAAWQDAIRLRPTEFYAALDEPDKKYLSSPDPIADPISAAVAVQKALEAL